MAWGGGGEGDGAAHDEQPNFSGVVSGSGGEGGKRWDT